MLIYEHVRPAHEQPSSRGYLCSDFAGTVFHRVRISESDSCLHLERVPKTRRKSLGLQKPVRAISVVIERRKRSTRIARDRNHQLKSRCINETDSRKKAMST